LYFELTLAIMITDFNRPIIGVIAISFIGVCTLLFRYRVHITSKILILAGATFLSMFLFSYPQASLVHIELII